AAYRDAPGAGDTLIDVTGFAPAILAARRGAEQRATVPPKPTLDGVHLRDGTPTDADPVRASMRSDMKRLWPYRSRCDESLLFKRLGQLVPFLLARAHLHVADVNGAMAAFAIID